MLCITLAAAKLAGAVSRLMRRGGGHSLPGMVAEKFDPQVAAKLAAQLTGGVIIVTGTNGKTTTTKLLADMLLAAGEKIVTNRTGSNLKQGIVTALIESSDWRGVLRGAPTVGVFEVDEATMPGVAKLLGATDILVTNLFRDQLDRYGELESTAGMVGRGIEGTGARVYLNADDPMVRSLTQYVPPDRVTFFGVQQAPGGATVGYPTVSDSDRCPVCGDALEFSLVLYSHIGHYECRRGHFSRPDPTAAVTGFARVDAEGSEFTFTVDGTSHRAGIALGGLYNTYNALAALTVATAGRVSVPTALESLAAAAPAFGRLERFATGGSNLLMILVKNPAGFTQVLETFLRDADRPKMLIGINDFAADGRDVSWLWDVPFEILASSNPQVVVSGSRAADIALRLHYAGIQVTVATTVDAGLDLLVQSLDAGETGFVLPTYTAMVQMRQVLTREPKVAGGRWW